MLRLMILLATILLQKGLQSLAMSCSSSFKNAMKRKERNQTEKGNYVLTKLKWPKKLECK